MLQDITPDGRSCAVVCHADNFVCIKDTWISQLPPLAKEQI